MRKIKTVVLDRLGASKFFASRDFTPLELTEWYFSNLRKNILKILSYFFEFFLFCWQKRRIFHLKFK